MHQKVVLITEPSLEYIPEHKSVQTKEKAAAQNTKRIEKLEVETDGRENRKREREREPTTLI